MRKSIPVLDALLPRTVQEVLAATMLHPEKQWYLSDLARVLETTPSSLQRILDRLVRAGILARRREGNRVYFQAVPECPILVELQNLLVKTVGLAEVVRAALAPLADRIACAFVYGSIAASTEHSGSDVDLLVIGAVGLADISPVLRDLRERLGRPVNPRVYTASEFRSQARRGQPFVTNVLRHAKIFVVGNEKDLDRLVGREARRTGTVQQAGAR